MLSSLATDRVCGELVFIWPCLFLAVCCARTRYLYALICAYVNGDVWSSSLLRYESCGDVCRLSHSHAWPQHMALRQHTPCLHVLPFTLPLPLSPRLFFLFFSLLPRIHPFPQLCLVLYQTMATIMSLSLSLSLSLKYLLIT